MSGWLSSRRITFAGSCCTTPDRLRRSRDASVLIVGAARQALDLGYDVILDGVFNLRDYSDVFESLYRDHRGTTCIYQFDVGLDETIRRHAGRPLANDFGEDRIREWHDGWQPLPWFDERRVGPETTEELVKIIVEDLGGGMPRVIAPHTITRTVRRPRSTSPAPPALPGLSWL